jgi:hypothetical protein
VTDPAPGPPGASDAVEALWLRTQRLVAARAAHEVRNALNGVAVNLAVVQGRLARAGAAESLTRFTDAATGELERLTAQVEALVALAGAPRGPADVAALARQTSTLIGRGGGGGPALTLAAPAAGVALTRVAPEAARTLVLAALAGEAAEPGAAPRDRACEVSVEASGTVRLAVQGDDAPVFDPPLEALAAAAGVETSRPAATELVLVFPAARDPSTP